MSTNVPCTVTNDHYWHGGSACTVCGTRLRCGMCSRFVRADAIDEHTRSGLCPSYSNVAPCWPGECDATCAECIAYEAVPRG